MNKQQLIDQAKKELSIEFRYTLLSTGVLKAEREAIQNLLIPKMLKKIESAYDKGREDALTQAQSLLFTENGYLKEEINISDLLSEIEKLREKV